MTTSRKTATPRRAKATATKAATKAKAAGAKGVKVTLVQRALRDAAILACSQSGEKQVQIAKRFEISERAVRTIIKQRQDMPSLIDKAPAELLQEMVANLQQSIRDFETMAFTYAEEHPRAALAAKRGALDARGHLLQLLESTAALPTDVQLEKTERLLRPIAEELAHLMNRVERGEMTAKAAGARLGQIAERSALANSA